MKTELRFYSQRKHRDAGIGCWIKKPLPLAIAMVTAAIATPNYAQVNAAAGGPSITAAANGVPVVNIVGANASGLSHNRYNDFNVDAHGLILNNATQAGISQLGGGVAANANLGGKSAKIILNEVVTNNRSTLAGFTEINGAAAEMILANPGGITCNGCGFINTPRVTLTTGTPNIDGTGNLAGFTIRSGDIAIQGFGLDGSRQNYFDILSRSASIAGQINAKDLQIVAGSNQFDYATRTATAIASSGAVPAFAIDSSLLGGMYADRIRLIATENGVGVRMLGNVAANVDDLTLSSAGKIQVNNAISAQRDIAINYTGAQASDAISVSGGSLVAAHDLQMNGGSGGAIFNGGQIGANNNFALNVTSLSDSGAASDLRFAGHQLNLTTTGAAAINGSAWNGVDALNFSLGNLTVGANGVILSSANNGTPSGSVAITTSGDMSLANAKIGSGSSTQLNSTAGAISIDATGVIKSGGAAQIAAATAVNVSGASVLGDTLSINTNTLTNSGTVQGTNGSTITANSVQNSGTLIVSANANSDGTINAATLSNSGTIQSAHNLALNASTTVNNTNAILAANDLALRLQHATTDNLTLNNTGTMQAGGALSLRGENRSNRGLAINNGLSSGDKNSGKLLGGTVDIYAQSLANHGTLQADNSSTLDVTAIDNSNHLQDAQLILANNSGGSSTITATDINNGAAIYSAGALTVNTTTLENGSAAPLNNTEGSIDAHGNLTIHLNSSAFDNYGVLASDADLTIDGVTNFRNRAINPLNGIAATAVGHITANNISLKASNFYNDNYIAALANSGTGGNLSVQPASVFNNTGSMLADNNFMLALLQAGNQLALTNTGLMQAKGTLSLRGSNTTNRGLTLLNGDDNSDRTSGSMIGNTLDIYAQTITNHGRIQANNGGTIDTKTTLSNTNSVEDALIVGVGSTSALTINASDLNNKALIVDQGALTINTTTLENGAAAVRNHAQGSIYSGTSLTLNIAQSLDNYGLLMSNSAFTIADTTGNATVFNHTAYQGVNGASDDAIGQINAGSIDITAHNFHNQGYVDSGGGDINITADTFINETLSPGFIADTAKGGLVAGSSTWTGDANALQLINAEFTLPIQANYTFVSNFMTYDENNHVYTSNQLTDAIVYSLYTYNPVPGFNDYTQVDNDANYYYNKYWRGWSGQVATGYVFARDPLVAHINSGGNLTITINGNSSNTGAQINAAANLTIKAKNSTGPQPIFTNTGLTHSEDLYNAIGQALYYLDNPVDTWCVPGCHMGYLKLINATDFYILQSGSTGTANVELLSGVLHQQTGSYTMTGVTLNNGAATVQLMLPAAGVTSRPNVSYDTSGTQNGSAAGGPTIINIPIQTPNGTLQGLSFTLPTNPNGLFNLTKDPNASYLVESNPLYGLESTALGSDYLADKLGLKPGQLIQRLGDSSYENYLIEQQIEKQTNLNLLAGTKSQDQQMQQLMDNAVWESNSLHLSYGVALTADQVNNLKQDMLWMVETTVNGHKVLAPVVYLSNATRASVINGTQIVADNMAISGAQTVSNTNATISVNKSLSVQTTGDINNTNGTIKGGDISLHSTQGNINNTTTVTRIGDDDNHHDYINNAASITATGSLAMNADKGSITSTAANISAGGDASLSAGKDVTLQSVTLENKTTTHEHSGNWFTGESTTDIVKITQSTQGSNLTSGGNLTIKAGNNATVSGSQVNAKKDIDVDAKKINVVAVTETDTTTVHTSSSGWTASGANMSVGYQSSSSDSKQVDTRVVQSGISGGGNVTLHGSKAVTITGSDVAAGNDLTISTKKLTTNSAQATNSLETSTHSTTAGMGLSGDANSAGVGFNGNTTNTDGNYSSSTAVVSSLSSGGNMKLDVTGGSIKHEGTQIQSGGDFSQTAKTIDMTAAQNTYSSSQHTDSYGGGISVGADYGAQDAYDQTRSGNMPSASAPAAKIKAGASRQTTDSNSSGSEAVVSTITARGNVSSTSTGTTNMEGTQIQAGKDVTLKAKDLNYTAAQNTSSSSSNSSGWNGGGEIGVDVTGEVVGGVHGGYADANANGSQTNAVVGSIRSGGATTIKTNNDANFTGTQISSKGDATIDAGGNVNYAAAQNTSSSSSSSHDYSGSIDTSNKSRGSQGSVGGSAAEQNASSNATTAVVGAIQSESGNVTIKAKTGDVKLEGTNIDANKNIAVSAGRDVKFTAAENTSSSSGSGYSASGSLSGGRDPGKDNKMTMAAGGAVSGSGSTNNSNSQTTEQIGGTLNGRNIAITSGRDTSMVGTDVNAKNTVAVTTGGKFSMESAQTTTHASSSDVGGSFSAVNGDSKEDGSGRTAGFNANSSNGDSVKNHNAQINGSTVAINTGGDMSMAGANINGGNVTTVVGGNLIVSSRVDTNSNSATSAGAYLGGGTPGRLGTGNVLGPNGSMLDTGASGSYSNNNSSSATVTQQSGISGGTTATIVSGATTVNGGHIRSDEGGGVLSTQSLTVNDVDQHSNASSTDASGGLTRHVGDAPGYSHDDKSSASTIKGSVNVAQMSGILTQPSVQTALLLTKDLKVAAAQSGGIDNVPVAQIRSALTAAGVNVPANASDADTRQLLKTSIAHGQQTVAQQFSTANIAPNVTETVLGSLGF